MTMSKTAILKKLGEALNTVTDGEYGEPKLMTEKDGFEYPTLCWDGPSEWVVCSMGSSIFGPSFGRYATDAEPAIQEVLDIAKANGFGFEPQNNSQMCIWE